MPLESGARRGAVATAARDHSGAYDAVAPLLFCSCQVSLYVELGTATAVLARVVFAL